MEKNRLILYKQQAAGKDLTCYYLVEGPWSKNFCPPYRWDFQYPIPIGNVPKELAVLPFLGAVLPYALLKDAEVCVPLCEEAYAQQIQDWVQQTRKKYPDLNMTGSVVFETLGTVESSDTAAKTAGEHLLLYMEESRLLDAEIHGYEEITEIMAVRGSYSGNFLSERETREELRLSRVAELFGQRFRQIFGTMWNPMRELLEAMVPKDISEEFRNFGADLALVPYLWKSQMQVHSGMESATDIDEREYERQAYENRTDTRIYWDSLPVSGKHYEAPQRTEYGEYPPYVWLIGVPEHGNLGDHQIIESTREFLRDITPTTRIQEIRTNEYFRRKKELLSLIRPEDVIVFPEGDLFGNLWPIGNEIRGDAIQTWPQNRKIVFPQSVFFTEDEDGQAALEKARELYRGDKLLLTVRDPQSYKIAKANFSCSILLTPDIVMYSCKAYEEERRGALLLLRDDRENNITELQEDSIYAIVLRAMGESEVHRSDMRGRRVNPLGRRIALDRIFRRISRSEVVVTDSLHGLIFCVITGTPCVALGNAYHKIRSDRHWLSEFSYVAVIERIEELPDALNQVMNAVDKTYPVGRVRESFAELRHQTKEFLKASANALQKKTGKDPLVSVIVPVYNVENYLEDCLNSLQRQSYQNLEILCIDDGATDHSAEILAHYSAMDSRIRVLHQPNQGLSVARNTGIQHASGTYLLFVDSDDRLSEHAIQELVLRAEWEALDMLAFNTSVFTSGTVEKEVYERYVRYYYRQFDYPDLYKGSEMLRCMRDNKEYLTSVCLYLYRTEFLKNHNLLFLPGILREDSPFTFQAMMLAKRVGYLNRNLYCRRIAQGSIMTSSRDFRHVNGLFLGYQEMSRFLEETEELTEEEMLLGIEMAERVLKMARAEFVKEGEPEEWKNYPPLLRRKFFHQVLDTPQVHGREKEEAYLQNTELLQRTYYEKAERGIEIKELKKQAEDYRKQAMEQAEHFQKEVKKQAELSKNESEKMQKKMEEILREQEELKAECQHLKEERAEFLRIQSMLAKIHKTLLYRILHKIHLLP